MHESVHFAVAKDEIWGDDHGHEKEGEDETCLESVLVWGGWSSKQRDESCDWDQDHQGQDQERPKPVKQPDPAQEKQDLHKPDRSKNVRFCKQKCQVVPRSTEANQRI